MRMYLLSSDEDTLTGFRLAGVEGTLVENEEALRTAFDFARKEETVGIVLVTRSLSAAYPNAVLEEKKAHGTSDNGNTGHEEPGLRYRFHHGICPRRSRNSGITGIEKVLCGTLLPDIGK